MLATGRTCTLLLLFLLLAPSHAESQTPGFRQLSATRSTSGVDTLRARVSFSGGQLLVRPADANVLYAADIRYDAERARPTARFDASRGVLDVGTRMGPISRGLGFRSARRNRASTSGSTLELRLGRDTPTELLVDATAAGASMELGGIPVHHLHLRASAADCAVNFSAPNPVRSARLDLTARAASLRVSGVANANAERLSVRVTAGHVELDLRGAWEREITVDARATFGEVVLRLPADAGVRIQVRERLWGTVQGVATAGNGEYRSGNWDRAARRVTIVGSVTGGSLRVERLP